MSEQQKVTIYGKIWKLTQFSRNSTFQQIDYLDLVALSKMIPPNLEVWPPHIPLRCLCVNLWLELSQCLAVCLVGPLQCVER